MEVLDVWQHYKRKTQNPSSTSSDGKTETIAHITTIRPPLGNSALLDAINTEATRGGGEIQEE